MNLHADEVVRLVDLLRRNLLYQTPEITSDGSMCRVRVRTQDMEILLDLLDRAGGWDLSDEQRARVMARDCDNINKALQAGAAADLSGATVGELMMLLEVAEGRGATDVGRACVAELESRAKQQN